MRPSLGLPRPQLRFVALLGLAWAVTATLLFVDRWPAMGQGLFDADDAMRLVQVREFLAGRAWFDLHELRIDPPLGYDTHWSRLLDAGMAGLFWAFRPFADPALAETLMRAVWPLLWLLVAMAGVASLAWRIAGRHAVVVALVLSACAIPAFQHFKPGRIDHHNVQIALALAVVAAVAWSDRARHAATLAGLLTGLALAVGLEGLPFLAASGVAMALHFAGAGRNASAVPAEAPLHPLARYGVALAAASGIAVAVDVAPSRWGVPACDAMAINWLLAIGGSGLGLALVARLLPRAGILPRLAALALVGTAASCAFIVVEPRCLYGPFALTGDAVKAIWLDHVDEMEPLVGFVRGFPLLGAWLCSFPLVAALSALWLARDAAMRRDFGFALTTLVFILSAVATLGAEKVYSYTMWFAMPLVAALAARLIASSGWQAAAARLAAALVLTPTAVTAAAIVAIGSVSDAGPARPGTAERAVCTRNDAYASLAGLPPGLVVTDVNYGPFVLALTPHAVLAAPYHRIGEGMIAAETIFDGAAARAREAAIAHHVAYVAICGDRTSLGRLPASGSLWAACSTPAVPDWLAPIAGASGLFRVYRDAVERHGTKFIRLPARLELVVSLARASQSPRRRGCASADYHHLDTPH